MIPKIFLDVLILEEFCNCKCLYCEGFFRTGYRMRRDEDGRMRLPEEWKKMVSASAVSDLMPIKPTTADFFSLACRVIGALRERYDFSILKLSGGEVFLYSGLLGFVREQAKRFEAVQLLTNATIPHDGEIDELSGIANVLLQVSLDGTDATTNRARGYGEKVLERVLRNLRRAARAGIPLEINCVLTRHNAGKFEDMLKWLLDNAPSAVVLPRPVRGEPRKMLAPLDEQMVSLRALLDTHFDRYRSVLPPRAYMERVLSMQERGGRRWPCLVPLFVVGANNYGEVPECIRTGGLSRFGNALARGFDASVKPMLPSPGHFSTECAHCIVQYELLGMLGDGSITGEEVRHIPTFQVSGVVTKVQRLAADKSL